MIDHHPSAELIYTNAPTGRLTTFDHDEIRAAYRAGISVVQLAHEYDRRPNTIATIIRRGRHLGRDNDRQD